MQFEELFVIQEKLDSEIAKSCNLVITEEIYTKRILAFQVELSELANEIREFKFWSKKGSSPRSVIVEEYVDGLHFILSIGIQMKVDKFSSINSNIITTNFSDYFIELNYLSCLLKYNQNDNNYFKLFEAFLGLGELLEITENELIKSYKEKNKINHQRQASGY